MLDRVKESLFSVLDSLAAIHGQVVDLYAGTGSLGIECLSRGARFAEFVEQNAHVCRVIRHNLNHTGLVKQGRVVCLPVERYLQKRRHVGACDIMLMDPPYAADLERMVQVVTEIDLVVAGGVLVVGYSPRVTLAEQYGAYVCLRYRRLGDSCFSVYERQA